MNKIVDVNIKENAMTFSVYTDISIVNTNDIILYIDECSNVSNIYCDSPDNHDYVLDYNNCTFTLKEIVRQGETKETTTLYAYEISAISNVISMFDTNMKYLKLFCTTEVSANDYADGVYYNPNNLYNAEIKALRQYCASCLDDKQMQLIVLIVFKRQLLEQAIATSHNKEAIQYYADLSRLLNVSISTNTKEQKGCVNGMCKL